MAVEERERGRMNLRQVKVVVLQRTRAGSAPREKDGMRLCAPARGVAPRAKQCAGARRKRRCVCIREYEAPGAAGAAAYRQPSSQKARKRACHACVHAAQARAAAARSARRCAQQQRTHSVAGSSASRAHAMRAKVCEYSTRGARTGGVRETNAQRRAQRHTATRERVCHMPRRCHAYGATLTPCAVRCVRCRRGMRQAACYGESTPRCSAARRRKAINQINEITEQQQQQQTK